MELEQQLRLEQQTRELFAKYGELLDRLNALSDGVKGLNVALKNLQHQMDEMKKVVGTLSIQNINF